MIKGDRTMDMWWRESDKCLTGRTDAGGSGPLQMLWYRRSTCGRERPGWMVKNEAAQKSTVQHGRTSLILFEMLPEVEPKPDRCVAAPPESSWEPDDGFVFVRTSYWVK